MQALDDKRISDTVTEILHKCKKEWKNTSQNSQHVYKIKARLEKLSQAYQQFELNLTPVCDVGETEVRTDRNR